MRHFLSASPYIYGFEGGYHICLQNFIIFAMEGQETIERTVTTKNPPGDECKLIPWGISSHTERFWCKAAVAEGSPMPKSACLSRLFCPDQYMPPMSGEAGIGGFFSGMSATRLSVVRTMEATEAAFSMALRQTLVGSTMPSSIMSPYTPFAAS